MDRLTITLQNETTTFIVSPRARVFFYLAETVTQKYVRKVRISFPVSNSHVTRSLSTPFFSLPLYYSGGSAR